MKNWGAGVWGLRDTQRLPSPITTAPHLGVPWGVHLQGTMGEDGKTALTPRRPVADTTVYKFKLALPFH